MWTPSQGLLIRTTWFPWTKGVFLLKKRTLSSILILEKRYESKADRTGMCVHITPCSDHVLPLVCVRAGSLAAGRPWETWLVSPAVLVFTSFTQMLPSTAGAQNTLAPNFSGPSSGHQGPWMLTNLTFSSNQPYTKKVIKNLFKFYPLNLLFLFTFGCTGSSLLCTGFLYLL